MLNYFKPRLALITFCWFYWNKLLKNSNVDIIVAHDNDTLTTRGVTPKKIFN